MCRYGYFSYKYENNYKYEICIQAKIIKKLFSKAERNTSISELVHYDICEWNGILIRDGKRYFITFINDCLNTRVPNEKQR